MALRVVVEASILCLSWLTAINKGFSWEQHNEKLIRLVTTFSFYRFFPMNVFSALALDPELAEPLGGLLVAFLGVSNAVLSGAMATFL